MFGNKISVAYPKNKLHSRGTNSPARYSSKASPLPAQARNQDAMASDSRGEDDLDCSDPKEDATEDQDEPQEGRLLILTQAPDPDACESSVLHNSGFNTIAKHVTVFNFWFMSFAMYIITLNTPWILIVFYKQLFVVPAVINLARISQLTSASSVVVWLRCLH